MKKSVNQKLGITDQTKTNNVTNQNGDTLNNTLTQSSETINSGGKNIKNFNITINDGLISRVENLRRMASAYTDAFGITEVVLKEATFDQNQMRLFNVMPFRLVFSSDGNYEFLVEE